MTQAHSAQIDAHGFEEPPGSAAEGPPPDHDADGQLTRMHGGWCESQQDEVNDKADIEGSCRPLDAIIRVEIELAGTANPSRQRNLPDATLSEGGSSQA